jgi:hypothetical protein
MHGRPAQQSALVVHDWPAIWHAVAVHWKAPAELRTHGLPLQQSVAWAHELPDWTQPTPASPTPVYALHRGTPNGSRTHASNFGRWSPQQSERALETPHV